MKELGASARVTVTIEIPVGSKWGHDCKMDQVYDQARDEALNEIRKLNIPGVRIIGEPNVVAILVERER